MIVRTISCAAAAAALAAALTGRIADAQAPNDALIGKARAIHDRVLALDTHVDIDARNFGFSRNYTQDLGNQVNLPKMTAGGLDAAFFIVYVGQPAVDLTPDAFEPAGYQRAYEAAVEKFEAIHRLTKVLAPDRIELALTAGDVRRIHATGKKVALIGVENGYPLGDEQTAVRRVQEFYQRGARYLSLAHNGHNQLSDSNTGERDGWKWNGLSPLGRQVVAELNRVGIMIDVSHPSKASMLQTASLSKAPVIASHSSVRALCNHSRNMDDEQLLALKKNGGVIQLVALGSYVKQAPPSPERAAALARLHEQFGVPARGRGALAGLPEPKRAEYRRQMSEIDAQFPPPPRPTVEDFVDHIDYVVKKIGIDHAGIASDFDGGGGIAGWDGADETFNVTLELVKRGYTEAQIAKIWGGNLLRVLDEVQRVARQLQASEKPSS